MLFVRYSWWLCLLLLSAPVIAQNDEGRVHVYEFEKQADGEAFQDISGNLRCPTCTGLSVLDSDAPFSVQIKDLVQEQVLAGKNKEEILNYFEQRYGPWILRSPPKRGFNLLAWAIPVSMLIAGPILVWFLVWRRKKLIDTMGVRSSDAIVAEFEQHVTRLRGSGGTA